VAPIKGAGIITGDGTVKKWAPEIAVTVIACYPRSKALSEKGTLDVLVQDYRLRDEQSASFLADEITEWAMTEVEHNITDRLCSAHGVIDSSSSLRQLIETCDVAMTSLPAEGKPCFVIATDCRAVKCDSVLDLVRSRLLKDTSLVSFIHFLFYSHYVREDLIVDFMENSMFWTSQDQNQLIIQAVGVKNQF
jgi:hypothetical protein